MNKEAKKPGGKAVKNAVKKTMGKAGKLFAALLSLYLLTLSTGMECLAAEGYTYTVTFYPGNHGAFNGTGGISVQSSGTGVSVSAEGQAIKVCGLKSGDMVSFDAAMDGAVTLEEGSRYYVKGIRLSGRDNNTVDTSAFRVDGDRDYVVAYGIRGDMVSYIVNYQDEAGNPLAPSRSYYGNVGDKPVAAFLYVEGYEPMAYNLTKTLVSNEAENVFTFVYSRVISNPAGGTTGGETGRGDTTGDGTTAGVPGTGAGNMTEGENNGIPGNDNAIAGNVADGNGGAAGNGMMADGNAADGNNPENGTPGDAAGNQAGNPDGGEDMAELGEEDVPLDLMELDEEEVPLANHTLESMLAMEEGSRIFAASAIVVVVSAGILVFFAFWLKKHSKKTK